MANDNPYQAPGSSSASDGPTVNSGDISRIARQTVIAVLLLGVAGGILTCLLDEVNDPRPLPKTTGAYL